MVKDLTPGNCTLYPKADAVTRDTIARVQADGTCWLAGTTWQGMAAIRISIANWSTTEADIDASADAIIRSAGGDPAAPPGSDEQRDHSAYTVGTSARFYDPVGGGPLTGSSDDYAFGHQFVDVGRAPMYSYTIEVGHKEELGFHPDYAAPNNHYQKIEREVHAGLIEFLMTAVRWCRLCVISTAVYGSETHPNVEFLRRLRDDRRLQPGCGFR